MLQRLLEAAATWMSVNFGVNKCYFRDDFWDGESASASMSTQVYRARGNCSTRDHLKLATSDASPHHRLTYGCWEGQASPRGG